MDSVTQALLGASIGGLIAGRTFGRAAVIGGGALATLPDMDVVIDYGSAVANFTQHRGFSHSLLVLVPLAVLLALLLHRWRPALSLPRWLAFTGLILITHPLLDVLTTYGTQLFWPFGEPLAQASIFIIDPLYSLPLLTGLLVALVRPVNPRALAAGLVVSTLYLGWSLGAQQMISSRVEPVLARQGLEDAPRLVQPMPFTTLLWRVTVMAPAQRLEIVTGVFDGNQPLSIEYFPASPELLPILNSLPEGRRLAWFTDGFLHLELQDGHLVATDIRLGVPGAHPFAFRLARQQDDGASWQPLVSTQLDRPPLRREALRALWQRISGSAPILCLATLETRQIGETCS